MKKNLEKKNSINLNESMYILTIFIFLSLLMYISPGLNKNIYARSEFVPTKISESDKNRRNLELTEMEKNIQAVYKSLMNSDAYKANENFDRKTIKNKLAPSESVTEEAIPKFPSEQNGLADEGKMYEPRGREKINSTYYTFKDLKQDAGIFCRGRSINITGNSADSSNEGPDINSVISQDEQKEIISIFNNGIGPSNNKVLDADYIAEIEQGHNEDRKLIFVFMVKYLYYRGYDIEVDKNDFSIKIMNGFEPEENAAIFKEARDYAEDLAVKYMYLRENNNTTGSAKYGISSVKNGAKTSNNAQGYINPGTAYGLAEAYIKNKNSNSYSRNPNISVPEAGNQPGTIQKWFWNTEEGDSGLRELNRGNFTEPVTIDTPDMADLTNKSKDFEIYWTSLLNFIEKNGKNTMPSQEVIHAKRNDKTITFNEESPEHDLPEVTIDNPNLEYEPRFIEADNEKPDSFKNANFDKNSQRWMVGPYSLDYVSAQSGGKYFSTITNMEVYGMYTNDGEELIANSTELTEYVNADATKQMAEEARISSATKYNGDMGKLSQVIKEYKNAIRDEKIGYKLQDEILEIQKNINRTYTEIKNYNDRNELFDINEYKKKILEIQKQIQSLKYDEIRDLGNSDVLEEKIEKALLDSLDSLQKYAENSIKWQEAKQAYGNAKQRRDKKIEEEKKKKAEYARENLKAEDKNNGKTKLTQTDKNNREEIKKLSQEISVQNIINSSTEMYIGKYRVSAFYESAEVIKERKWKDVKEANGNIISIRANLPVGTFIKIEDFSIDGNSRILYEVVEQITDENKIEILVEQGKNTFFGNPSGCKVYKYLVDYNKLFGKIEDNRYIYGVKAKDTNFMTHDSNNNNSQEQSNTNSNNNNNGSSGGQSKNVKKDPEVRNAHPDTIKDDEAELTKIPQGTKLKNWELVIEGVSREQRPHYVPEPGEKFYISLPYDQNLLGISGIVVDFKNMIYGGWIEYYKGKNPADKGSYQAKVTAELDIDENEARVRETLYNRDTSDTTSQPLAYTAVAKWFETTRLLLDLTVGEPSDEGNPDPIPPIDTPIVPTPGRKTPKVRFVFPMGGYVWEDKLKGEKHLDFNNIYDQNEKKIPGLKVNVYRVIAEKNGKSISKILEKQKARLYITNSNKENDKEIYTDDEGKWGPFDVHDVGFSETEKKKYNNEKHVVFFEVEYMYDGINYEPVIPLAELGKDTTFAARTYMELETAKREEFLDNSVATENKKERIEYNKKFAEIVGDQYMTKENETTGKANEINNDGIRTGNSSELKYKDKTNEDGKDTSLQRKQSKYIASVPQDNPELIKQGRYMHASTLNTTLTYAFEDLITAYKKDKKIPNNRKPDEIKVYKTTEPYMTNINLGLYERSKLKTALTKDLVTALVVVNRKAYEYKYDLAYKMMELGRDATPEDLQAWLRQSIGSADSEIQYKLDVYKTDYIFRTEIYKNDDKNAEIYNAINKEQDIERKLDDKNHLAYTEDTRKIDIFLTYKISVYNTSLSDNVYFTQINDYYDARLEPVLTNNDIAKVVEKDPEGKEDNGPGKANETDVIKIAKPKYKIYDDGYETEDQIDFTKSEFKDFMWEKVKEKNNIGTLESTDKKAEFIVPAGGRADIYTTYRIKRTGNELGLENSLELGKFANMAEISGFAGYDITNGDIVAKVDNNSAPENVNPQEILNEKNLNVLNKSQFEDDTDGAPLIEVSVPKNENKKRKLSGNIWEEFRNTINGGVRTGNGIKEDDEKGIPNKTVTLEERVSVKRELYNKNSFIDDDGKEVLLKDKGNDEYVDLPFIWPNKITTSDGEINVKEITKGFTSKVKTDEQGNYEFKGIPAGNYVVKIRYSDSSNPEDLVETVMSKNDTERRLPFYYNGLDFKSTLFYGGNSNKVNTTWISKEVANSDKTDKYSYIRDDEYRRIEITKQFKEWNNTISNIMHVFDTKFNNTDVQKEKLKLAHENTNMVATTPKINFSVEYYENLDKENTKNLLKMYDRAFAVQGVTVGASQENIQPYDVVNINAGIVERPKTKNVLTKELDKIEFKTNSDVKILEANFKTVGKIEEADKITNKYNIDMQKLNFKTEIDNDNKDNLNLEGKLAYMSTDYSLDGLMKTGNSAYAQKFAHLQLDEDLLQGAKINIRYKIRTYNLSEVDSKIEIQNIDEKERGYMYYTGVSEEQKGYLMHEKSGDYIFGKYVKPEYYSLLSKELDNNDIAKVKIQNVLDIISLTMGIDKNSTYKNDWSEATRAILSQYMDGVDSNNYETYEYEDIKNGKTRKYMTPSETNLYISTENKEKKLVPFEYIQGKEDVDLEKDEASWYNTLYIETTKNTATLSNKDDMIYDNVAEILKYSTDNANRDRHETPGTIFTDSKVNDSNLFAATVMQYDAGGAEYITLTPPTGLSIAKQKVLPTLLAIGSVIIVLSTISSKIRINLIKEDKKDMSNIKRTWVY